MIKTLTDPKVFEMVSGGCICQCGYTDPREGLEIKFPDGESSHPCKEICCNGAGLPGMYLWYIEDGVKSTCPSSDSSHTSRFRKIAERAKLRAAVELSK